MVSSRNDPTEDAFDASWNNTDYSTHVDNFGLNVRMEYLMSRVEVLLNR